MIWSLALVWALWRRVMGGGLGLSRPLIIVAGVILAAFPYALLGDWIAAGLAGTLTAGYWTPGHNFMSDRALWRRYGPPGVSWMICRRFWPTAWTWPPFIDGWTAVAEIGAGAIFGLIYVGAYLLWVWVVRDVYLTYMLSLIQ